MKKILVISWFFPPINSSEGIVTYKLLKNSKFQYDVFTQKNNSSWSYGDDECLSIEDNINCIYSDALNLNDFVKSAYNYYLNNIEKYDIIMTRSMPEESHIIGLKIKEFNNKVKWIASFGDPIGNNPFTLLSLQSVNPYVLNWTNGIKTVIKQLFSLLRIFRSLKYKYIKNKNYRLFIKNKNVLEQCILSKCDYVICNNPYEVEYICKNNQVDESKFIIFPHSFDKKLYSKKNISKANDKIIFRYIGHLDDIRTPRLFLEAIRLLYKKYPDLKDKAVFEFYGNMSSSDKLYIIDNYLGDVVKIMKPVNYLKSLELMKSSDWLIHIDANLFNILDKNVFFAAKLADYIGSGSNIIGLTMQDGASADILRNLGAIITTYSSNEIMNYLYLIIYGNYNVQINKKYVDVFNSVNIANHFDLFVNNVIKNNEGVKNEKNNKC